MNSRHLVDPELVPALEFAPQFAITAETLPAARTMEFPRPPVPDDGVTVETRTIPGPAGAPDVRVLIYTPPGLGPKAPAFLHIHGGGYVLGSPETSGVASARGTAAKCNCVVVSTSYRLAPETRWPGAVEDCYASLSWMHANADSLGIDTDRIAIGGESAGGGHAAALAIYARDIHARNGGGPKILFQLLTYPMLDDRIPADSYTGEFVWTRESNRFGWTALLGVPAGSADVPPASVPARVADLSGLPPAYISTGALDLFVEEDIEYARRLIAAGVPTELRVVPGAWHGFDGFAPEARISREFTADRRRALSAAFTNAAALALTPEPA